MLELSRQGVTCELCFLVSLRQGGVASLRMRRENSLVLGDNRKAPCDGTMGSI